MTSKSELITLLQSRGIRLRRGWGQNFLIDQNFQHFIIRTAELCGDDSVLEIGSGPGILTRLIAEKCRYVWAVEVDKKLFELAQSLHPNMANVRWLNVDILREIRNPKSEIRNSPTLKVISNLPYSSSGAIIMALLESTLPIRLMVLMVQNEMADRLVAKPGTKEYNAFTILVNLLGAVKIVRRVPPELFFPQPEVNSAVITIIPSHTKPPSYQILKGFLQSVFRYRRKTIGHILSEAVKKAVGKTNPQTRLEHKILTKCGISPTMRPEEITTENYLRLVQELMGN